VTFIPQDRPRLGRLAGVGETYLIAAAEAAFVYNFSKRERRDRPMACWRT
jgi:hypothetical protein